MRIRAVVVAVAALSAGCVADDSPAPDDADDVEIIGPWRSTDADRFADVLRAFEDESGISVRYIGSVDFATDLRDRTGVGGDAPDIAMVPQPSVIRELAERGAAVPLPDEVRDAARSGFTADALTAGTIDGRLYAVPYRTTVKSLVWYRPALFAERGWAVPRTLDELSDLVDRVDATDDLAPWCFGIGAGSATGWAATDWAEDLVLRSAGVDAYEQWVAGDVGFGDPPVADAFERFRALVLDPGRTVGGRASIVQTPVDRALDPLLDEPPDCAMHRQADFAVSWVPDDWSIGDGGDLDFFVLPGESGTPPPLLIGGTHAVQFVDDPATNAVMAYLAGETAASIWAARGGYLSVHRDVPLETYPEGHLRDLAAAIDDAATLVFDASDRMPPEIGTNLLWERITAWIADDVPYTDFAAALDDARRDLDP